MCPNPQPTKKWAQGCSKHPFYREFWWGMHAWLPCMCHCPLLGSCKWQPQGLPFACAVHQAKTVMLVTKLSWAWQASHSKQSREYGQYCRSTHIHPHVVALLNWMFVIPMPAGDGAVLPSVASWSAWLPLFWARTALLALDWPPPFYGCQYLSHVADGIIAEGKEATHHRVFICETPHNNKCLAPNITLRMLNHLILSFLSRVLSAAILYSNAALSVFWLALFLSLSAPVLCSYYAPCSC